MRANTSWSPNIFSLRREDIFKTEHVCVPVILLNMVHLYYYHQWSKWIITIVDVLKIYIFSTTTLGFFHYYFINLYKILTVSVYSTKVKSTDGNSRCLWPGSQWTESSVPNLWHQKHMISMLQLIWNQLINNNWGPIALPLLYSLAFEVIKLIWAS